MSLTPYRAAVEGMSCIGPRAPRSEFRAWPSFDFSDRIVSASCGSTPTVFASFQYQRLQRVGVDAIAACALSAGVRLGDCLRGILDRSRRRRGVSAWLRSPATQRLEPRTPERSYRPMRSDSSRWRPGLGLHRRPGRSRRRMRKQQRSQFAACKLTPGQWLRIISAILKKCQA